MLRASPWNTEQLDILQGVEHLQKTLPVVKVGDIAMLGRPSFGRPGWELYSVPLHVRHTDRGFVSAPYVIASIEVLPYLGQIPQTHQSFAQDIASALSAESFARATAVEAWMQCWLYPQKKARLCFQDNTVVGTIDNVPFHRCLDHAVLPSNVLFKNLLPYMASFENVFYGTLASHHAYLQARQALEHTSPDLAATL